MIVEINLLSIVLHQFPSMSLTCSRNSCFASSFQINYRLHDLTIASIESGGLPCLAG